MKTIRAATPLALIMLLCTMVFVLFGTSETGYAKKIDRKNEQQNAAENIFLQDFAPLSDVSYTVFSSGILIAEGNKKTDKDGNLTITHKRPAETFQTQIVYNFNIVSGKDYLDVLVRMDLKSGKITMSGSGLDEFSDVLIVTPKGEMRTKSDWSGAFAEEGISTAHDNGEFEIAMHGFDNFAPLAKRQSPAIIKVLAAPGGGGADSGGVNEYKLKKIKTPLPPLSVDDDAHIKDTIKKITENYIAAMQFMTDQLSAVTMQSTMAIGTFFDAKLQLEAQREMQRGTAEVVKDYHPSEEMCRVGTFMRSVASTEQKANADRYALNQILMARYKNQAATAGAESAGGDMNARLKQFREVYCNRADHNAGLDFMCEHDQNEKITGDPDIGGKDETRFNKDIDYFRTIEMPGTLDIDYSDKDGSKAEAKKTKPNAATMSADEEDVIALAKNIYWPHLLTYADRERLDDNYPGYMDAQRLIAMNNIAHSSFTNIASMKARSAKPEAGEEPGWLFMKTLMKDFGISEPDIETMIGKEPSYWAQMEVLTKKMYQLPDFYTNLYDKPVNVERMGVALDAIKLMQMRDHYNSALRREMLSSAQLETELMNSKQYNQASIGLTARLK